LSRRQAVSDAAVAALGAEPPVTTADLAAARRQIDVSAPDLTLAAVRPIEERLAVAVDTVRAAEPLRPHPDSATAPINVLVAARQVVAAGDATYQQLSALNLLTTDLGDRDDLTDALRTANLREQVELAHLDRAFLPTIAERWAPVRRHPVT